MTKRAEVCRTGEKDRAIDEVHQNQINFRKVDGALEHVHRSKSKIVTIIEDRASALIAEIQRTRILRSSRNPCPLSCRRGWIATGIRR